MKRNLFLLIAAAMLLSGLAPARADDAAVVNKLKEALRNALIQLRTVTADRDNLQAENADLQTQKDQLTAQVAALTKQSATDKAQAAQEKAVLQSRLTDQTASIAQLQKALQQWEDADKKAVALLNDTEAKRAKLADQAIKLQRVVDDQKTKNLAMFKLGMEVLDRYEKFGLGQALFAKEPFTGITRTKFETLVQDYSDKLEDQRIKQ